MKQIQEASKQGKEVPPAYVNVTDAVSPTTLSMVSIVFLILAAVRASPASHGGSCHRINSCQEIHKHFYSKYGRIKSLNLLMSKRSRT